MGCGFFSLLLRSKSGASWSAPLVHPLTKWLGEQLLVQTVLGYQSVMEAFGRIFSSTCRSPHYSHLEIWTLPSPSYLSVLRCLGVASGVRRIRDACFAWFNSGYMFYERLLANFTYFLRAVHSDPWRSSPFRRMEHCAQLMLRVAVSLRAIRTLNLDNISTSSPWWR